MAIKPRLHLAAVGGGSSSAPLSPVQRTDSLEMKKIGSRSGEVSLLVKDGAASSSFSLEEDTSYYQLQIEVFGVDEVGTEIADQLREVPYPSSYHNASLWTDNDRCTILALQVVESRLSSTTLAVISSLLLRNPLLKLTGEDMAFLQPSPTPDRSISLNLPPLLSDCYLYLHLLRQNLLLYITSLVLSGPHRVTLLANPFNPP